MTKNKLHLARIKWMATGLILLSIFVILAQLPMREVMYVVKDFVQEMGALGMIVFSIIYIIATILLIPGAALTLAAGFIFGLLWGMITASVAATAGSALAFLIARYAARDKVAEMAERHPHFGAVDRAVSEGGWRIVGLLRLSPVIPFNLQNYMYGLTGIRFWPCVLASWVGMLPGTFMCAYLGYLARAGLETAAAGKGAEVGMLVLHIAGFAAIVAVALYVTKLARGAVSRQMQIEEKKINSRYGVTNR